MKIIHKIFSSLLITALTGSFSACGGGTGTPKAGPKNVVQEPKPPILEKFDQAAGLSDQQKYAEAGQQFMAIYQEQPLLTKALYNSAANFELAADHERARQIYQKYLQLQPKDKAGLMGLIRTSMATGNIQEIISKVDVQLDENPADTELLLSKATLLRLTKEPEKAIATARKIILRDQKNLEALRLIGMCYIDLNQLDMATTFFNNALQLAPDDTSLRDIIGVIQFNRGGHNEALDTFNKSLAKGADPIATANIGLIALKFRDYQKAADSLNNAIEAGLKNCQTYKALGYAQEGLQQGDAAISALKSAQKLCGTDVELLYDMAKIYNILVRNYNEAKPLYKSYIAQNGPRSAEAESALEVIAQIEASQMQMDNMQDTSATEQDNSNLELEGVK